MLSAPFLVLAAVTLAGACAAMMLRGLVHCALALAVALAGIGTLYVNLGGQFLGLAQMLVYVGAVAVLIVFVILLTRSGHSDSALKTHAKRPFAGILVAAALFGVIAWSVVGSHSSHSQQAPGRQSSTRQLGVALTGEYVLPLEVIGVMLTAALIGAAIVAMKEKQGAQ
jgi:NADH-quinone oxidoreductase subunit J